MGAIYEQEFVEGSFGSRPKRRPHDALRALYRAVRQGEANIILEADVKSFFDMVHRRTMVEMLEQRIADKSFMRLVGKCLHVGVLEGQVFTRPDRGTVQGSIISPVLGNIYLHNVLDKWFEEQVKPRMRGKVKLIRYCDDFGIGFELMEDAERVRKVLVSRIRGHLVYFGVNDNHKSTKTLVHKATRAWHKWLNRRSQRARLNWKRFEDLLKDYPLPQPRVYVNLWVGP